MTDDEFVAAVHDLASCKVPAEIVRREIDWIKARRAEGRSIEDAAKALMVWRFIRADP